MPTESFCSYRTYQLYWAKTALTSTTEETETRRSRSRVSRRDPRSLSAHPPNHAVFMPLKACSRYDAALASCFGLALAALISRSLSLRRGLAEVLGSAGLIGALCLRHWKVS